MFRESVGSAFFWPSDEGAPEPGSRVLQGELEVKKSLKLGFLFPRFSVRVSLFAAMYPHRLHTPTSHLCGHIPLNPDMLFISCATMCACSVAD